MKRVLFIKNTVVLTATALALRLAGMVFRVFLADSMGAEGLGLYQVVLSVYALASTFAASGISTAVTRLVSERLSAGDGAGAVGVLRTAVLLSLSAAAATTLLVNLFARPIGLYLVGDPRSVPSIRILCLGLPFAGVCSCLRGYFLAARKTMSPCLAQLAEQGVRIALIMLLIKRCGYLGPRATTAAVLFGDSVAEAAATLIIYLVYRYGLRRRTGDGPKAVRGAGAIRGVLRIAAPISGGRYLHSLLRTAENLLVPSCLVKYSASKTVALEQFGMIKGMALPLLMFPASILTSVSTLLVPELSESTAAGGSLGLRHAVERILSVTAILAFLISALFFTSAYQLGRLIYQSPSVGYLIRAIAPLVPFMYLDLISDGVLKGLDRQSFLFKLNAFDSALRVVLVTLFVPSFGMTGFLGVMFLSNILTSALSLRQIVKASNIKLNFCRLFLKPCTAAFLSSLAADFICRGAYHSNLLYIVFASFLVGVLYFAFLLLFGEFSLMNFLKQSALVIRKKRKKV